MRVPAVRARSIVAFVMAMALAVTLPPPSVADAAPMFYAAPTSFSAAYAISADGTTAVGDGTYAGSSAQGGAYAWSTSSATPLGFYPGQAAPVRIAWDVSGDGSVVVGYGDSSAGQEAFRWTAAGGVQGLGDLAGGSFLSIAEGVSRDGNVVVGTGNGTGSAFRWTAAGGMLELPRVSFFSSAAATATNQNGGVTVGYCSTSSTSVATRWTGGDAAVAASLGDLAGGATLSAADAVSGDGNFVVGYGTTAAGKEAFRWSVAGGLVSIGDLPGASVNARAFGVSDDGNVVVGQGNGINGNEAFVWDPVNGMRNLGAVLSSAGVDMTGWKLSWAQGVSADGMTVAGTGTYNNGTKQAFIAVIPEPASPLLAACATAALLIRRRRMRRLR